MGYTVLCKADIVRIESGGFASWEEAKEVALKLLADKITRFSKMEAAIKRAYSFAEYMPDDEVTDEEDEARTATLLRHAVADEVTCWSELWTLLQDQFDAEEQEVEAELKQAEAVDLGPSLDAAKNRERDLIRDQRQEAKKRTVK